MKGVHIDLKRQLWSLNHKYIKTKKKYKYKYSVINLQKYVIFIRILKMFDQLTIILQRTYFSIST